MADVAKKIGVKNISGSGMTVKDIGSEAQNVSISYDSNGDIIEDINEPGVVINSTKSAVKAIKDINTILDDKIDKTELSKKVNLVNGKIEKNKLPNFIDDVIEGYYYNNKFYKENTYVTEIQGEENKIYIDKEEDKLYYYKNNEFVKLLDEATSLAGLNDVELTNVYDGDSLIYSNGKWINRIITNHVVQLPTVVGDSFTYNGQPQGPTITITDPDFSKYVTLTGDIQTPTETGTPIKAIGVGTYKFTYSLKNTFVSCWSDQTNGPKTYEYKIEAGEGYAKTDKEAVVLTPSKTSDTVTILDSSGNVTINSIISQQNIISATINNNILAVNSIGGNGLATIILDIAASDNYTVGTKTISVDVTDIPLVSWDIATDDQVTAMVNGYYHGDLSLNAIKSVWAVGQEREVNLSAIEVTQSSIVGESHRPQTVKMVIMDFDHDLLVDTSNDKTKALITIGQKDCLMDADCEASTKYGSDNTERGYINSTDDNSTGWNTCARRTWCNSAYYNALPSYLKSLVKQVKKSTAATGYASSPTWYVNHDYCFLPSEWEVFGAKTYSAETGQNVTHIDKDANDASITMPAGGSQYSYYAIASNRYKLPKWSSSEVSSHWWERSPSATDPTHVCRVFSDGRASRGASNTYGIAPSCCL